jgi:hypothetical protein
MIVYCCRLLEAYREENHYFLCEFDINPRVTLRGKLLLLHHCALEVPMTDILKSKIAAINTSWIVNNIILQKSKTPSPHAYNRY